MISKSKKQKGANARSAICRPADLFPKGKENDAPPLRSGLLDGRAVANQLLTTVAHDVETLKRSGVQPNLAFFLVGENPASVTYVRQKERTCQKVGIAFEHIALPETVTTDALIAQIEDLNGRPDVHGILVQLPLPSHVDAALVLRAIDPKKDVDGFHAYNLGKMLISTEFETLVPATPKGVIRLLEHYKIPIQGSEVVVVGHSNIVGKPLSVMLLNRNATVTICHKYTAALATHTKRADILIVATGVPGLIKANMVKKGAVVIDVGINRVDGKLVGDVDFERVSEVAAFLTPVPGGVGPMTVACLMENIVIACQRLTAG